MPQTTHDTATTQPLLLREQDAGVLTLTLNRPAQYNVLSEDLLAALQAELDGIAEDESIRVVVLAGAGRAFCAGHDLKEMRRTPDQDYYRALFGTASRVMLSITRLPQPVIARVHGIAAAAGCQLVATCDLAVAGESARFATSGINVGLFCTTPGVALGRNMARKQAMEMLLTGDFIDAASAVRFGLVNRVVPDPELDDAVADLANRIAAKSPAAVRLGKQAFYRQLDRGIEGAYDDAAEVMACNMMAEDSSEGIDAFIEKRKPRWRGR
jgi:enoyl-CoA hydratase/carnithine racemase